MRDLAVRSIRTIRPASGAPVNDAGQTLSGPLDRCRKPLLFLRIFPIRTNCRLSRAPSRFSFIMGEVPPFRVEGVRGCSSSTAIWGRRQT